MKKKLILLCLGVFLLCGCEMKNETTFTINEDKSMNLEIIMGYDDELIDAIMSMKNNTDDSLNISIDEDVETEDTKEEDSNEETKENTDEERRNFLNSGEFKISDYTIDEIKQKGFSVQEYNDDKYMGYILTKRINSIDDLVGIPNFNLNDIGDIDNKKIFAKDGSVYKGKILVGDPTDIGNNNSNTSQYNINVIYNFVLNLPNKSNSNNATIVSEDEKKLTWNLAFGNIQTIEFEFEFPSLLTFIKNNMFVVAGIAVILVLLIVAIITLILKKSKNSNSFNDVSKNSTSESAMAKNDNITAVNPTSINQDPVQNINNPIEQTQLNNQILNETSTIQNINQSVQPISNNLTENQTNMIQTQSINQQVNLQQNNQNMSQNEIISAMNSIPVMPNNQSTAVQFQEETSSQSTSISNNIQSNNIIPDIKPIMPETINTQVIPQPDQLQQTLSQQPNPNPIEYENQIQNNISSQQSNNINN